MKPAGHFFSRIYRSGHQSRNFISSKILLYVVIVVSVFFAYQTLQVIVKRHKTETDIQTFEKQVSDLQNTQTRLQELNKFLETDFFAEKEARLKLGMQKQGEQVVVLNDNGTSVPIKSNDSTTVRQESSTSNVSTHADTVPGGNTTEQKQKSNPAKWWDYFFAHNGIE